MRLLQELPLNLILPNFYKKNNVSAKLKQIVFMLYKKWASDYQKP